MSSISPHSRQSTVKYLSCWKIVSLNPAAICGLQNWSCCLGWRCSILSVPMGIGGLLQVEELRWRKVPSVLRCHVRQHEQQFRRDELFSEEAHLGQPKEKNERDRLPVTQATCRLLLRTKGYGLSGSPRLHNWLFYLGGLWAVSGSTGWLQRAPPPNVISCRVALHSLTGFTWCI